MFYLIKVMSRIGKQNIKIPKKVNVFFDGCKIEVIGPKGKLSRKIPSFISINVGLNKIILNKVIKSNLIDSLYGILRSLILNMLIGVSSGFQKRLYLNGVGYRAYLEKQTLFLNIGYSQFIKIQIPKNLEIFLSTPTNILLSGFEKNTVGEFAAKIKAMRPPEPYKKKGILYKSEILKQKTGKTNKK